MEMERGIGFQRSKDNDDRPWGNVDIGIVILAMDVGILILAMDVGIVILAVDVGIVIFTKDVGIVILAVDVVSSIRSSMVGKGGPGFPFPVLKPGGGDRDDKLLEKFGSMLDMKLKKQTKDHMASTERLLDSEPIRDRLDGLSLEVAERKKHMNRLDREVAEIRTGLQEVRKNPRRKSFQQHKSSHCRRREEEDERDSGALH
uniref:Uncharacterized protein n=1 Tax=Chromera velia CCMP2878 TaxID=1169474 RepID=A0A0G4I6F9_9ALVE|eukprot:Cvel_11323.t1-p1 / transcript=Cvel_11323.t1 / gene=Cvel_11323 / organism=Chromera_velia_CCMP2878 / gene_product=hypothetical protein / transcript_product=hypothetical protein / location=Cvel_scaffold708:54703-62659(+) / protein_length=201 / sequence_SO=supercontig / SO=protein_coding / is_pseudo=false